MEAEEMLVALRTEQEQRCVLGKQYQTDTTKMSLLSHEDTGNNFTYTLQGTGATATRIGKDYEIKMLSYKTGELCCSGSGCAALNKGYPSDSGGREEDHRRRYPSLPCPVFETFPCSAPNERSSRFY